MRLWHRGEAFFLSSPTTFAAVALVVVVTVVLLLLQPAPGQLPARTHPIARIIFASSQSSQSESSHLRNPRTFSQNVADNFKDMNAVKAQP